MPTNTSQLWVKLIGLACTSALALAGCEPPPIPTTGGLVSVREQADEEPGGLQLAEPLPTTAAQAESASALPAEPDATLPLAPQPVIPPAASVPLAANPDLIPVDQANSRGPQSARSGQSQGRPTTAPRAARNTSIRLSAGVALPQSLPTGTAMGMSIDYAFAGGLNPSSTYVWVISSEGGGDVEAEVELAIKGTLQSFVPNLRSEHRPFNCRIEEVLPDGRRLRVSNVATMQTSY